jgi:tRNA (cmo5U34)-methyltransferase
VVSPTEQWKSEALVRKYLDGIRAAIPLAAQQLDVMLRMVAARGAPVSAIADIGCGNGVLAATLLDRYPQARATLVDFSEPMLREARARFQGREGCRVVEGDLQSPAWVEGVRSDAPFDVVVSGYAIHHLGDERKRALYGELFALLAPGGIFVHTEHVASPSPWLQAVSDELLIDSFYEHQRSRGEGKSREEVAAEFVKRPDKEANLLAPVEAQCGWLREIGFEEVDCYFKLFELAVFGGRRPE